MPRHQDMLAIDDTRFQFDFDEEERERRPTKTKARVYTCHINVRAADGMEEFRAVDHDLLFGRMAVCHVHYAYSTLSRMNALVACDEGDWWVFNLAKGPLARSRPGEARTRIDRRAMLAHEDELAVGPLLVRFELLASAVQDQPLAFADEPRSAPETEDDQPSYSPVPTFETPAPESETSPGLPSLHLSAMRLDHWLKAQDPQPPEKGGWGILKKLADFWTDTPETTRARGLANSGRLPESFEVLEKAIRARPENPGLLRELYRLYKAAEFGDLCYRPLRQIEKVMKARGKPDPWVLEELARVCTLLGATDVTMYDRAMNYWSKLEAATGASRSRENQDTRGRRALQEGGFAGGKPAPK